MSYLVKSSVGECKSETYARALECAIDFIREIQENYSVDPADWFAYIVDSSTSLRELVSFGDVFIHKSGFIRD